MHSAASVLPFEIHQDQHTKIPGCSMFVTVADARYGAFAGGGQADEYGTTPYTRTCTRAASVRISARLTRRISHHNQLDDAR